MTSEGKTMQKRYKRIPNNEGNNEESFTLDNINSVRLSTVLFFLCFFFSFFEMDKLGKIRQLHYSTRKSPFKSMWNCLVN